MLGNQMFGLPCRASFWEQFAQVTALFLEQAPKLSAFRQFRQFSMAFSSK